MTPVKSLYKSFIIFIGIIFITCAIGTYFGSNSTTPSANASQWAQSAHQGVQSLTYDLLRKSGSLQKEGMYSAGEFAAIKSNTDTLLQRPAPVDNTIAISDIGKKIDVLNSKIDKMDGLNVKIDKITREFKIV